MKKVVILVVAAMMMAACGSGSGSGSGSKGSFKTNGFFGRIPAMYAELDLLQEEYNKEYEKLYNTTISSEREMAAKQQKYEKMKENFEKKKDKLEAELNAEIEKLNGKDVPFSCSDAFNQLRFEPVSATMKNGYKYPLLDVTFHVKENHHMRRRIPPMVYYYKIYCVEVAKDGLILGLRTFSLRPPDDDVFKKGQTVKDNKPHNLYATSEKWANFAGIKFITEEEYNKCKEEGSIELRNEIKNLINQ